eukprot:UN03644
MDEINLNYSYGDTEYVASYFLAAQRLHNGNTRIVYSGYVYSWKESENWSLNSSCWETEDRKNMLHKWISYQSANAAVEALNIKFESLKNKSNSNV